MRHSEKIEALLGLIIMIGMFSMMVFSTPRISQAEALESLKGMPSVGQVNR